MIFFACGFLDFDCSPLTLRTFVRMPSCKQVAVDWVCWVIGVLYWLRSSSCYSPHPCKIVRLMLCFIPVEMIAAEIAAKQDTQRQRTKEPIEGMQIFLLFVGRARPHCLLPHSSQSALPNAGVSTDVSYFLCGIKHVVWGCCKG